VCSSKAVIDGSSLADHLFDPAHLARLETHLDAVRMPRGYCQNILNYTVRSLAGALIFFFITTSTSIPGLTSFLCCPFMVDAPCR